MNTTDFLHERLRRAPHAPDCPTSSDSRRECMCWKKGLKDWLLEHDRFPPVRDDSMGYGIGYRHSRDNGIEYLEERLEDLAGDAFFNSPADVEFTRGYEKAIYDLKGMAHGGSHE